MLELKGVTKVYKTGGLVKQALSKVSVNFRPNEFVAILGPSGSGKTTLLNIIGGLDHYTSGDLKINEVSTKDFHDKDWDAYRNHRIGFVFQSYNLIPHQTVLANVKLALTLSGVSKREANKRAKRALEEVGLGDQINKKPNQLSGGQMQRVAIARALVNNPDIVLADEPTGALDSVTSIQVMDILKRISKTKLVIMVTHNPELAEKYATRIVTLKDGEITSDTNKYDGRTKTNLEKDAMERRNKRTKMSFVTSFSLSLQNLLTKKARTLLVALAGSIGIIGIALILAVSTGFQAYIDSIERDTLTSYPLVLRRESTDVTGVMLGALDNSDAVTDGETVTENQMLSAFLGGMTMNDLKSFETYLDNHYNDVKNDLKVVENEYSVDPLIYTVDSTGKIAKVNPNSVFSSLLGNSILTNSSYMSMTSAYTQYDLANMKNDLEVVTGRFPEKYNELLLFLPNKGRISDYLTYSLGFHDNEKLNAALTQSLTGETVEFESEPLTLSYEELMGVELKLVNPADLYQYNASYNVFEDMSSNTEWMSRVYEAAEPLKIVGVATAREGMIVAGSGVLYLPELVVHVINQAAETEIVKKQLAEPSINVFTGQGFGETEHEKLEFSDLVSVDTGKIQRAFSFNLNKEEIKNGTTKYIESAAKDLAKQITDEAKVLIPMLGEKAEEIRLALTKKIQTMVDNDEIDFDAMSDEEIAKVIASVVDSTIKETDFSDISKRVENFDLEGKFNAKVDGMLDYLATTLQSSFSVNKNMILSAFTLNFSEEELARLFMTIYSTNEATYSSNLLSLGYQALDDPSHISFYFSSFDGKTDFIEFINRYNDMMSSYGQEEKVIEYSDTTAMLISSVKSIVDAVSYVLIAFVSISLVVSSIMIGVITYISVYERTKEIGILRAIGASKRNISSIFNAETFIIGFLSGLLGVLVSYLLIPIINAILHHYIGSTPFWAQLDPRSALVLIALAVVLTLIGGLIPARAASKKDPVEALRSE